MVIAHNLPALSVWNKLNKNTKNITSSFQKLSSGLRINCDADDAAGLAISEKMRSQIRGLSQASKNAQDGISLIQTAEGGMSSIHQSLQRMRELCVQAANGTLTADDREMIQAEINQIKKGIDVISNDTEFNGLKLLDGSIGIIPAIPAIPPTASVDVAMGSGKTVLDGWIPIGSYGARIKINPDEQIQDDECYQLSIDWKDGLPTGMVIHKFNSGLVVANTTELTYSVNGVTFDVSQASSNNLAPGNQPQGNVVVHAGHNGYPETPEKDNTLKLQIGANAGDSLVISISDVSAEGIGLTNGYPKVHPASEALTSITLLDTAIDNVSSERATMGALQNTLECITNNLNNAEENLTASESRIRDVDMAKEMMKMTKYNILGQANQAILAQANQQPQKVLQLL
ncbi:MAG: flagellin [Anaerovorax sp.]|nr:flagellin [Anaerovorax sp.]